MSYLDVLEIERLNGRVAFTGGDGPAVRGVTLLRGFIEESRRCHGRINLTIEDRRRCCERRGGKQTIKKAPEAFDLRGFSV